MADYRYFPELDMVIADGPGWPSRDEASAYAVTGEPAVLQEGQTYYVKFYGDETPAGFGGARFVLKRFPGSVFEINFRNHVGLTRIGPVCLRVQNDKIGDELYHAMLDYIAGAYANLIFSFHPAATGQSFVRDRPGRDIAYTEYLFLKRYLLDASPDIDGILAVILADPHHRLHRETNTTAVERIRKVDPAMLLETLSSPQYLCELRPGHHLGKTALGQALYSATGRRLYPATVREETHYLELDTNENRFVKFLLEDLCRRLQAFAAILADRGTYLNPTLREDVADLMSHVDACLADPLWREIGRMTFVPANSQVLQRREGYRQLFQLYALLQLVNRCDFSLNFEHLLETKDTATLFEYWCFFVVKEILDESHNLYGWQPLIDEDPCEQELRKGLTLAYDNGVSLSFNRRFEGSTGVQPGQTIADSYAVGESYSHPLVPDIVIEVKGRKLILDAKYKGKPDEAGLYGEGGDGRIGKPKDEDIYKMHTYRDAIAGVCGAYILYPGIEAKIFPAHQAKQIYEGVGALPLRPNPDAIPTQLHKENLAQLIGAFLNRQYHVTMSPLFRSTVPTRKEALCPARNTPLTNT